MSSGILAAALALSAIVGIYSMFQNPHDRAGAFSDDQMAATNDVETIVPDGEWHAYGRTAAGRRYSPLDQITPDNIDQLKVAWTYNTGDVRGPNDPGEATYEVTPLMIDGTVYICTPHSLVIALDAVTGEQKWKFDPHLKQTAKETTQHLTCRGVSYFDGSAVPAQPLGEQPADTVVAPSEQQAAEPVASDREDDLVAKSVAEVTTQAAGVPQNFVTGQAKKGAPNPRVERET